MYRSALFANFARLARIVRDAERAEERRGRPHEPPRIQRIDRREWLARAGRTAAATAVAAIVPSAPIAALPRRRQNVSVGIVGAGLAGLACADTLKAGGMRATLYDAANRTGGRCFSLRGFFPGQVAERGGEFIDNLHKTMLGYARRFDLTVEDVNKEPGDVFYFLDGEIRPEAVIVDELREFVTVMRADLRRLSREVTAAAHTAADEQLDRTSLLEYLEGRNAAGVAAGPVIKEAIIQAYVAEYGLAASEQSCLNFLLFIHADRRSKFTPFSVFSDERYHVIDGNDRIVDGLTSGVAGQIELGMSLVRVRRTPAGLIELTFQRGGQTLVRTHDVVVLTIPFTVLRQVELDASLDLPPDKQRAIEELGYGTNAKMMVGFSARPWAALGSNGSCVRRSSEPSDDVGDESGARELEPGDSHRLLRRRTRRQPAPARSTDRDGALPE